MSVSVAPVELYFSPAAFADANQHLKSLSIRNDALQIAKLLAGDSHFGDNGIEVLIYAPSDLARETSEFTEFIRADYLGRTAVSPTHFTRMNPEATRLDIMPEAWKADELDDWFASAVMFEREQQQAQERPGDTVTKVAVGAVALAGLAAGAAVQHPLIGAALGGGVVGVTALEARIKHRRERRRLEVIESRVAHRHPGLFRVEPRGSRP